MWDKSFKVADKARKSNYRNKQHWIKRNSEKSKNKIHTSIVVIREKASKKTQE